MIDIRTARARLQRRIEAKQAHLHAEPEDPTARCEHNWQPFKETIRPDNPKFAGEAHFVVAGCTSCRKKRRTAIRVSIQVG